MCSGSINMCAGPLSATESISSFFFSDFAGFCMPQPFSSSSISRYVLNAED